MGSSGPERGGYGVWLIDTVGPKQGQHEVGL